MAVTELTRIKHVQGNVLKLAIPLTLREVTLVDGSVSITDSDFVPTGTVKVIFGQTSRHFEFIASMRNGNVAVVEDKGTLPVGTFAITVLCNDEIGNPMRFKQLAVVRVFDATKDAGIDVGIEFESQEWLLNGAIFIAVKGEDGKTPHIGENGNWFIGDIDTNVAATGVGIESITVDETNIEGAYNTVTITLTNGEVATIHIKNGSTGEPILPNDIVRDNNYVHTDNNYTTNEKNNVSLIPSLFGSVRYDTISRRINFFSATNNSTPLAYIDATPFVKDGLINQISVQGGYLVLKYNSDANRDDLRLDLKYIFDSASYYTKQDVNNLLSNAVTIDPFTLKMSKYQVYNTVIDSMGSPYDGDEEVELTQGCTIYHSHKLYYITELLNEVSLGAPIPQVPYTNAATGKQYIWRNNNWVEISSGSGSGNGYNVSYSNGVLTFSGSNQPTYNNGILTL